MAKDLLFHFVSLYRGLMWHEKFVSIFYLLSCLGPIEQRSRLLVYHQGPSLNGQILVMVTLKQLLGQLEVVHLLDYLVSFIHFRKTSC